MKYDIVISDFDDTLARTDKTLSDYTRAVIAEYRRRGGHFIIATGRMHSGIMSQLREVGLDDVDIPIISYQGAHARTTLSNQILYDAPLKYADALDLAMFLEENKLYFHTYYDDTFMIEKPAPFADYYAKVNSVPYVAVGKLSDYMRVRGTDVPKVLAAFDPSQVRKYAEILEREFGDRIQVKIPTHELVDNFSHDAGKEKAVAHIASLYGKTIKDCMIFGDNYNDYNMVTQAGFGVAIGNAVPELLRDAHAIAQTNNEDGVAKMIETQCLS